MKITVKFALAVALVAMGAAEALAQSTNTNTTATTTFTVQNINVALTGFATGGQPVRIGTKDIIGIVGETNNMRGAKLILMTPADNSAPGAFFLRTGSGKNITDTDVSGFFTHQTLMTVSKSNTNAKGVARGTQWSIDQFGFGSTDTASSFTVQGFTTTQLPSGNLNSSVNGTGNVKGNDAVLRGVIGVNGAKSEQH